MNTLNIISTVLFSIFAVPTMSTMPKFSRVYGLPVPTQDKNLHIICSGVEFGNEYLFQVLSYAYEHIDNDFGYPVKIDGPLYQRKGPYYIFPLLRKHTIYDTGIFSNSRRSDDY